MPSNELPEIPVVKPKANTSQEGLPEIPVVSSKPKASSFMPHFSGAQTRQHLAGWEANTWEAWRQAVNHPTGSILEVMGAPQRVEGAIAENISRHSNLHDSLNNISDLVWHPTDEKVQKARSQLQSNLGFANDADIDTMINGHNWHVLNQLKPYVKNALKTINNVATDTLGDPFAIVSDAGTALRDLGVIKTVQPVTTMLHHAATAAVYNPATKPLIHAGADTSRMIAGHIYNHLVSHGAGPAFAHLKQAVRNTKNMASNAHRTLEDVFVTRPDLLRAGLTHEGRDVRIQLENAQRIAKHKDGLADAEVVNDANKSVQRYAQYVHAHGSPRRSTAAATVLHPSLHSTSPASGSLTKSHTTQEIRAMTPEERLEAFRHLRDNIHENELARKSNDIFSPHAPGKSLTKGGSINWSQYKALDNDIENFIRNTAKYTKRISDMGRAGIELNPLPHGVQNVGTLSALGGGLNAMTHGVAHMVRPVDHVVKGRLDAMGAGTPEYIGGHTKNFIPGYAEATNAMSGLLGKMEHGWRAGLLDHLDHVLGPSAPGSKEEYLKGALINKKLGDYTNQSAFVRFFSAIGGPFVAYHLGILPKAVIDSVKENPINYLTVSRLKDQNQKNREGSYMDELTSGDPVTESAKGAFNPVGYVLSSSSMPELWVDGNRLANDWTHPSKTGETWDKGLLDIAETHIAPLGLAAGAAENIQGKSFAGQNMTLTDHLAAAIMGALNQHIHHFPSEKTEKADERFTKKHAFEWLPE